MRVSLDLSLSLSISLPLYPGEYWRSLRAVAHTVDQSYLQAQGQSLRRNSEDHNNTVSAMASLSMASLTTDR